MENKSKSKATEVGKYIVNECLKREYFINTLKLNYLLIISKGLSESLNHQLFKDVVVPTIGGLKIESIEEEYKYFIVGFKEKFKPESSLDEDSKLVIDYVLNHFGRFNPYELGEISAMVELRNDFKYNSDNNIISDSDLKEYFQRFVKTYLTKPEILYDGNSISFADLMELKDLNNKRHGVVDAIGTLKNKIGQVKSYLAGYNTDLEKQSKTK